MLRQVKPISILDKTSAAKINCNISHPVNLFKVKPPLPDKPVYHGNKEIDRLINRNLVEFSALYSLFQAIVKISLKPFPLVLDIFCADMLRILELCRKGGRS